jgi:hypothetical protein
MRVVEASDLQLALRPSLPEVITGMSYLSFQSTVEGLLTDAGSTAYHINGLFPAIYKLLTRHPVLQKLTKSKFITPIYQDCSRSYLVSQVLRVPSTSVGSTIWPGGCRHNRVTRRRGGSANGTYRSPAHVTNPTQPPCTRLCELCGTVTPHAHSGTTRQWCDLI